MKKMGLGRGLDALLPEIDELQDTVAQIALTDIDPNNDQPRRDFNDETLQQLADSIKTSGILQPLIVVERGGRYRIVAGERRFRAARLAGLSSIPCIIRDMDATQQMEAALIENLQREDLNPMDEATAIRMLMESCDYTQEEAAQRLGKSRPAVANQLRLLSLPRSIQEMVRDGRLSAGHARVLAGIADPQRQQFLAQTVIRDALSVRALEQLAQAQEAEKEPKKEKPVHQLPLELQDMESRFREAFGVRTTILGSEKKGRLVLQYYSKDELERIYAVLEKL